MPRLSLTDLVDIVVSSGTPKANRVRAIKNRPDYSPAIDFYKPLRDHIEQAHRQGKGKAHLKTLLASVTDKKKLTAYPPLIEGHRKWWGNKNLVWFQPPSSTYTEHGIDVSVNPELGLKIGGKAHLIKLYFKADPLTKNRIDVIHYLMHSQLAKKSPADTTMAILEVRRSKLYTPTVAVQNLSAILSAELAYVATLWPKV
jgi:hypothetical protein